MVEADDAHLSMLVFPIEECASPQQRNRQCLVNTRCSGRQHRHQSTSIMPRTLAKLRDKNLLRVKGNTITVQKPRELQKLLQENLGEL